MSDIASSTLNEKSLRYDTRWIFHWDKIKKEHISKIKMEDKLLCGCIHGGVGCHFLVKQNDLAQGWGPIIQCSWKRIIIICQHISWSFWN